MTITLTPTVLVPMDMMGGVPGCGDVASDQLLRSFEDDEGNRFEVWCMDMAPNVDEYRVYYFPPGALVSTELIGRCPFEGGCNSGVLLHVGDCDGNSKPDRFVLTIYSSKDEQYGDVDDNGNGIVDEWRRVFTVPGSSDSITNLRREWYDAGQDPPVLLYMDEIVASPTDPLPAPQPGELPIGMTMGALGLPLRDVDQDGSCTGLDTAIVAFSKGSCVGDVDFRPAADLDGDGCVTTYDLLLVRDCNGNDVSDVMDIVTGTALDSNGNQVLDECEVEPRAPFGPPQVFGKAPATIVSAEISEDSMDGTCHPLNDDVWVVFAPPVPTATSLLTSRTPIGRS